MGIGALLQGVGAVAGLFGKKSKPPTPSEMVIGAAEGATKGAEMYGFNRLTLLKAAGGNAAMGGGGGQQADWAGTLAALGGLFDKSADGWAQNIPGSDPLARAIQAREASRLQAGTLQQKLVPPSFGYNLHTNTATQPVTVSGSPLSSVRPAPNPFVAGGSRKWVHAPNGDLVSVPSDIAARLGVEVGGNLMGGDWTELHGELLGEAGVAAAGIGTMAHMTNTGLGAIDPGPGPGSVTGKIPPYPRTNYRGAQDKWRKLYGKP